MDPRRFSSSRFGELRTTDGLSWFDPAPIPTDLDLDRQTWLALSRADDALGRLAGVGRLLRDRDTLVRLFSMKEALASSRIEGTQADLGAAFQADARPQAQRYFPEATTVLNVVAAIQLGLREVRASERIGVNIAMSIHRQLFAGEGGAMRHQPVWVGSPTERPETADYVPPLPERLDDALRDWERFAQSESTALPPLVRAALLHYQFLTIHPFLDGNGRVGRILVPLFLCSEGRLPEPLLYLSPYLETRRREYYDRLQAVRERGDIQQWIQFFLTAIEEQARDGVDRAERLLDLMDRYRNELAGSRSRSTEVVDLLFRHAVVSASLVRDELGMSHQGALNLIRGLERRGWLMPIASIGRGGAKHWVALEIIEAIEAPTRRAVEGER